jgi:hypothetical protein
MPTYYLRQAKTGDIYDYHEIRAKRPDMVLVDAQGNVVSDDPTVIPKPTKRAAKKEASPAPIPFVGDAHVSA